MIFDKYRNRLWEEREIHAKKKNEECSEAKYLRNEVLRIVI